MEGNNEVSKLIMLYITGIVAIVFASIIDGFLEGWEFDGRTYFEKKFNKNPMGFWGSRSWERKYTHPNLWNKYMGVFDFYHVADDIRKYGYITGAFLIGFYSGFVYLIIAIVLSVISKRTGMKTIRINNLKK